jgi:hypothetical protein
VLRTGVLRAVRDHDGREPAVELTLPSCRSYPRPIASSSSTTLEPTSVDQAEQAERRQQCGGVGLTLMPLDECWARPTLPTSAMRRSIRRQGHALVDSLLPEVQNEGASLVRGRSRTCVVDRGSSRSRCLRRNDITPDSAC